jgi:hypothetical protein
MHHHHVLRAYRPLAWAGASQVEKACLETRLTVVITIISIIVRAEPEKIAILINSK